MHNLNILIIDDSETDRYLLTRLIRKTGTGVDIHEAEHGADALALLSGEREGTVFASNEKLLIFLDVNMPIMGGFEFLDELENQQQAGTIDCEPIVISMLTSSQFPGDIDDAMQRPLVRAYLHKFPTPEELCEILGQTAQAA